VNPDRIVRPAPLTEGWSIYPHGTNLFLTGFLVLFLELASIRWFAANVIFLHFFTNVVLLACYLGMSCGCIAARKRRDWLGYFPLLALGTVCAGIITLSIYSIWSGLYVLSPISIPTKKRATKSSHQMNEQKYNLVMREITLS
jgi:hypothetical protein